MFCLLLFFSGGRWYPAERCIHKWTRGGQQSLWVWGECVTLQHFQTFRYVVRRSPKRVLDRSGQQWCFPMTYFVGLSGRDKWWGVLLCLLVTMFLFMLACTEECQCLVEVNFLWNCHHNYHVFCIIHIIPPERLINKKKHWLDDALWDGLMVREMVCVVFYLFELFYYFLYWLNNL